MLRLRLMLGPVMVLALIGTLWLDQFLDGFPLPRGLAGVFPREETTLPPGLALMALAVAVCPVAAWELTRILRAAGIHASRTVLTIAAVLGVLVAYVVPNGVDAQTGAAIVSSVAVAVLVVSLVHHSRGKTTRGATAAACTALMAFVYLGLMFGFMLALRRDYSGWVVMGVLVVTKSSDIGAYFVGRSIGRHKLIPWLSPGKTWEGLIGGALTAGAVAVFLVWFGRRLGIELSPLDPTVAQAAIAGVLFAFTGQLGDLLASLLKRDARLKDSSSVVPGFGGVLDVIDSILLVAPVAYWTLRAG